MIGRLRGEVIERNGATLLVDVHGVGYMVHVSPQCTVRLGEKVDLHVHTHVRDDAIQLFGFQEALEREVFDLLISVPGIGPVKAMAILATPASEIVSLTMKRDARLLGKLPGVGKKTAERLLVDLAEKMGVLSGRGSISGTVPGAVASRFTGVGADLVSALVNLGFRPAVAEETAQSVLDRLGPETSLEVLLRDALSHRSR